MPLRATADMFVYNDIIASDIVSKGVFGQDSPSFQEFFFLNLDGWRDFLLITKKYVTLNNRELILCLYFLILNLQFLYKKECYLYSKSMTCIYYTLHINKIIQFKLFTSFPLELIFVFIFLIYNSCIKKESYLYFKSMTCVYCILHISMASSCVNFLQMLSANLLRPHPNHGFYAFDRF